MDINKLVKTVSDIRKSLEDFEINAGLMPKSRTPRKVEAICKLVMKGTLGELVGQFDVLGKFDGLEDIPKNLVVIDHEAYSRLMAVHRRDVKYIVQLESSETKLLVDIRVLEGKLCESEKKSKSLSRKLKKRM